MKEFKPCQIRWNESVGDPTCPYLYRWVFLLFGYSIRLHRWIRSDDKQHFHDHAWSFLTILLKGSYTDVSPTNQQVVELRNYPSLNGYGSWVLTKDKLTFGSIRFRRAEYKHYVDVPTNGAWSLLFCGRPKRKWGFWVKGKLWRPLRYFSRFGLPPCNLQ